MIWGSDCTMYFSSNISIGIVKMNFEPTFGLEVTDISPPSCYTIIFEIVRPRPMPPLLISFVFDIVPKNLKRFERSSEFIPIPVSSTSVVSKCDSLLKSIATDIFPAKVNFVALPNRLKRTYLYLFLSENIL